MPNAQHLIARSVSHTEIIHADWSDELETDLYCECEDSAEASTSIVRSVASKRRCSSTAARSRPGSSHTPNRKTT